MRKLKVGSRGSELALVQARSVLSALAERHPSAEIDLVVIRSTGDRVTDRPLNQVGGAGVFIKEIESALLDERIDFAVHSMKDIPSEMADGLVIPATLERLEPRDALVSKRAGALDELPVGAQVATGSLRRRSQVARASPGRRRLRSPRQRDDPPRKVRPLGLGRRNPRGRRADAPGARGSYPLSHTHRHDAPCGGAREHSRFRQEPRTRRVRRLLSTLDHRETAVAVTAERSFLRRLQGGCRVPIAAHGVRFSRPTAPHRLRGLDRWNAAGASRFGRIPRGG